MATDSLLTTPLEQTATPQTGQTLFGINTPGLDQLGTTIPPEVQQQMDQLTAMGLDMNQRALNRNKLNFGAGDRFNSAAARSQAFLGNELQNSLLSNVLGLGAQSAEQQRNRVFGERQNLLQQEGDTFRQGRDLAQQLNLTELGLDQQSLQILLSLLGSTPTTTSIGESSGSGSSDSFGFNFGLPLPV